MSQLSIIELATLELHQVTANFISYIRNECMNTGLSAEDAMELVDECDRDLELAIHCAITLQHAIVNNLHVQKNFTVLADEARADFNEFANSSYELFHYDY